MFNEFERDTIREKLIAKAKADKRIVSAAVVGSYASGKVDKWSDIDLTFGVEEKYRIGAILEEWTTYIEEEFKGSKILDVQRGDTIYRVFILPGLLQVDISFSPAGKFGSIGKNFILLFGKQFEKPQMPELTFQDHFGWILHHLIRAKYSIERERLWQAEFWISEARDYMLKIACIENGLNPDHGRGFDDLPEHTLIMIKGCFIKRLSKIEMLITMNNMMSVLPELTKRSNELCEKHREVLRELHDNIV